MDGGGCGGARHLRAAAELELADHRALGVVGGGAREEEALRQLLLVELGEDVLVGGRTEGEGVRCGGGEEEGWWWRWWRWWWWREWRQAAEERAHLVGEVAEELHDLLELVLERLVREALAALLEQVVAELGEGEEREEVRWRWRLWW